MAFLKIEVEDNGNSYAVPMRLFSTLGDTSAVRRLKMDTARGTGQPHLVTGWSSEGDGAPVPAYWVAVEDSGAGISYLVYGGDWGLRFKPQHSDREWALDEAEQFGEPYLLLGDPSDILE